MQDVDDVQVLSVHGVLLKPLHELPVLQRQTDLRPETCKNTDLSQARLPCTESLSVSCPDLLRGRGRLTSIQAVQQIKTPDSDLEAEGRQEELAGSVQGQVSKHSLLTPHCAAARHVTHGVRGLSHVPTLPWKTLMHMCFTSSRQLVSLYMDK